MICSSFDTDLTDDQWELIAPMLPKAKTGGRPRTTDLRSIVNAILFLLKEGCRWRTLEALSGFPPWETVYGYFVAWRRKGIWRKIHYAMYEQVRVTLEGREAQPSAVVIDSQSIKTTKMASIKSRGYDGGKKVKGRKRVLVVDTLGLLVDGSVVPANMHDTKGGEKALAKVAKWQKLRRIKKVYADKGFQGPTFASWVKTKMGAVVETSANLAQKVKHFVPAKKRWVVERSHAWLLDYRRLVVDHERLSRNSMTFIRIAFVVLMLRRLCPVPRLW